jgi:4-carboxymuconolactone decarboxylase
MPRIPDLKPEEMNERQKALQAKAAANFSGPVRGPFPLWLRNPEVGMHATEMVMLLRDATTVARPLREMAILMAANHHGAPYPWAIHAPLAEKAGLAADVIAAIRAGKTPSFVAPDQASAHALLKELIETGRIANATYAAAEHALGREALIDLVSVATFYCGLCLFLNAFEVPAPE